MQLPLNQVLNPTDDQRHEMLRNSLDRAGRPEDYEYILNRLSPPPNIINYAAIGELKGKKIGIIGGGLAGMSAAFELRRLGANIHILEASPDRIGGRVYTHYFDSSGRYYGEYGAMRIPVSHETTWYYINLFGLNTFPMTTPRRNNFYYVHNRRFRVTQSVEEILYPLYDLPPQERAIPYPELADFAFEHRFRQLPPDIRAEMITIQPTYSPEFIPLMNMSLRQNFEQLGLSQEAINLISSVNSPAGALLNISYDEMAHEEYTFDFINTYRVQGGNVNLPLAFYQSFLSQHPMQYADVPQTLLGTVTYHPGHTVSGIYHSPTPNQVLLQYRNTLEGTTLTEQYDYVICAIPFSTLRDIQIYPYFTNIKMQAILELNYSNALKSIFFCNRRFWETDAEYGQIIGGISFTDKIIQSMIYPSDHNQCLLESTCTPEEPGSLVASYNLHLNSVRLGNLEKERRFEVIKQNVEEVHGLPRGYLDSIIEQHKTVVWNNEPNFRGAFALTTPGQKQLFAYEILRPEYNNRMYFAGEHTSTKHAWIQGALWSGKLAANMIAQNVHNTRSILL